LVTPGINIVELSRAEEVHRRLPGDFRLIRWITIAIIGIFEFWTPAVNEFLANVKELRSDLSDWLVHFTKGTNDQAESTLTTILSEATLRSFHQPPAISFSEAPLGELNKLFRLYRAYRDPRFAPFGIAVPKTWLFERGGRPVIYGPAAEYYELPEAHRYRHVTYHPPGYDFAWMREWRIATNALAIEPASTLVLLPTDEAAFGLTCDVEVKASMRAPERST
jgi:hypothetical protein